MNARVSEAWAMDSVLEQKAGAAFGKHSGPVPQPLVVHCNCSEHMPLKKVVDFRAWFFTMSRNSEALTSARQSITSG